MASALPSTTRTLNYGLASFLLVFLTMIGVYYWVI